MRALQELALDHEAIVVWDLSHAVGAVPVDLNGAGAQLAVGCTYKYLNAGPGAPGWLYVATSVQDALLSPIQGWFGQRDQFAMERDYDPADGVVRFLAGTPSVLGLTAVESGVAVLAEAGVGALRAKSVALTGLAIDLHREWLVPLGFELGTPSDPGQRGSHVTLRHPLAWPIKQALADRSDVVTDFRPPDAIRFGIAPIYTRFTDVWDALDRLRRLVEAGEHEAYGRVPGRVT
jgi:kynureninase